jgi:hypothetical protein
VTDIASLIQSGSILVESSTHAQTAQIGGNFQVSVDLTLTNDLTQHSQITDSVSLTQYGSILIDSAIHEQTADSITLTQGQITLSISDAIHLQTASAVTWHSFAPMSRTFLVSAENRIFSVAGSARQF